MLRGNILEQTQGIIQEKIQRSRTKHIKSGMQSESRELTACGEAQRSTAVIRS